MSASDQMRSIDDYRQLIVADKNDAPIRLEDIARVEQRAENIRLAAWANQQPAIVLNIQRQRGVKVIAITDDICKILPQLIKIPHKLVNVKVLTDHTTTIRASVSDGQFELLLSIALVVMVIHLFLRNGPLLINHLNQFQATTVSFNVAGSYSLEAAVNAITQV